MDELRSLVLGIAGGVIGAFFKFWIEDLREWQKKRLSRKEKLLLRYMKAENGKALFKVREGRPPFFKNQYQDVDHPENDFCFEDHGEVEKLQKIGLIEQIPTLNADDRLFRLSGKAYE